MHSKTTPLWQTSLLIKGFIAFVVLAISACGQAEPTNGQMPDEVVVWPLRDTSNLIKIRIPGGYRFIDGMAMAAVLGPDYSGDASKQGYSTQIFAETNWPNMMPRDVQEMHRGSPPGGGQSLVIQVSALLDLDKQREKEIDDFNLTLHGFEGSKYPDRAVKQLERDFHIAKFNQAIAGDGQRPYSFPLEQLSGKYGLERVGVNVKQHPKRLELGGTLKDIYYLRGNDGQLKTFIECMSEAYKDQEEDPSSRYSPQCEQRFIYEPLYGEVAVRYRRIYLSDWRAIQDKTQRLLQSFIESK